MTEHHTTHDCVAAIEARLTSEAFAGDAETARISLRLENAIAVNELNSAVRDMELAPGSRTHDALRATLLFHAGSPWTPDRAEEWARLTGGKEATTRGLCDFVREVLS